MVLKRRDWLILIGVVFVLVAIVLNVSFGVEWAGYVFALVLVLPIIELIALWIVSKGDKPPKVEP